MQNVVPTPRTENFVVDDEVGDAEQNNDSEDDMDELFDSVCTICDDGGKLLWYAIICHIIKCVFHDSTESTDY